LKPASIIAVVNASITLVINGETRTCPPVENVRGLLAHLGIDRERVAVEVNGRIARRRDWESAAVTDQDRIEIVQFVGGG
jgi:sulfur carrier protein